jgi:oligosaccharide repeat unit polymerase
MTWIIILYLPLILAFLLVSRRRGGVLNPDGLFVLFNALMLIGTSQIVDPLQPEEVLYAWLVLLGTSIFTVVATCVRLRWRVERSTAVVTTPISLTKGIWLLYFLSLAVCVAYYRAVGHITLISSLNALSEGGAYDSATERLASYSGARYLFPGYVNQFKNAILPVLTVAIVHNLWSNKRPGRIIYSAVLLGTALIMVAGTGQRGAAVIAFLIAIVATLKSRLLSGGRILIACVAGFAVFSVLTLAAQRNSSQLEQASSLWDRVIVFGGALSSRVLRENQESGLAAFHYTQTLPTAWGRQWLDDLMGILPGNRGSDLANRVFEMLYGTARGTAPESIWGGIYYNFGIIGLIAVPTVLAALMAYVTRRFFLFDKGDTGPGPAPNFLVVLALSGMAVSLGSWVAGSPMTVLNVGFPTYVFLYWFGRRSQRGIGGADAQRATGAGAGRENRSTVKTLSNH